MKTIHLIVLFSSILVFPSSVLALTICPGVNPDYCDIYYDLCIDDCQGSCYEECADNWEACMYGTFWTYTEVYDDKIRKIKEECIPSSCSPPAGLASGAFWERWKARPHYELHEAQVCPNGQRFDRVVNSWTGSTRYCYEPTGNSCRGDGCPLRQDKICRD